MCVEQIPGAGCRIVDWQSSGARNFVINLNSASADRSVERFLRERNAAVVTQRVFGGTAAANAIGPSVHLLGNGASADPDALSIQIEAVSGVCITPVVCGGRVAGTVYEDAGVSLCRLTGIQPHDLSASRAEQAASVFRQVEAALNAAGMSVHDVVRTWFFIDRILESYGEFNRIRTEQFSEWGLMDRVLPASTGVGTANSAGAALMADVLAIQSQDEPTEVDEVASPLQCPATAYSSSFSRAVEVGLPGQRLLYISGTASIEPGGETAHAGDLEAQIALTMEVTGEILRSRGMTWSNATRAIAYFSNISRLSTFEDYCRRKGLTDLPFVAASADICRDDLLFELELDAVAPAP